MWRINSNNLCVAISKDIPPDPTEKCVTRSSRYICTQQTEDNTTYEQILLLTFLPRPRHNLPLPSICPMDPPEQLDWRIEGNSTVHYVSTRDGTIPQLDGVGYWGACTILKILGSSTRKKGPVQKYSYSTICQYDMFSIFPKMRNRLKKNVQ